jgi:hypothetical protein
MQINKEHTYILCFRDMRDKRLLFIGWFLKVGKCIHSVHCFIILRAVDGKTMFGINVLHFSLYLWYTACLINYARDIDLSSYRSSTDGRMQRF